MKPIVRLTCFWVLLWMVSACSKEKNNPLPALPEKNQWVLDSMKRYYYWSDQMPKAPAVNTNNTEFFKGLLNVADRFSYIDNPEQPETDYSSYAFYGFEYSFITSSGFPGRLLGIVTLVVPNGPAALKGLRRGDIFTAVNGVALSQGTSEAISQVLGRRDGLQLQTAKVVNGQLLNDAVIPVTVSFFTEKPVYITRVFNNNGKKAGYIFYNKFDGNFDRAMLDSLGKLKAAGVSELILDMRFNHGGDVSSAAKLCAALAPVHADQPFVIYQANRNGGRTVNSFQETMLENPYRPTAFQDVQMFRIEVDRVIVLTSRVTASAAELVINCLKPYTRVIQVGNLTRGKDMGSFPVYDERTPKKISFILHPLIYKLYNARSEGDYPNGILPDFPVSEDNLFPLSAFGDPADPLLRKALEISIGLPVVVAGRPTERINGRTVFSSAEQRAISTRPVSVKRPLKQFK